MSDNKKNSLAYYPIKRSIIDPLYEPLTLNTYKHCNDLQRLEDYSHKRYGLSSYLLLDITKLELLAITLGIINKDNYNIQINELNNNFNKQEIQTIKEKFSHNEGTKNGPIDAFRIAFKGYMECFETLKRDNQDIQKLTENRKIVLLLFRVIQQDLHTKIIKQIVEKPNEYYKIKGLLNLDTPILVQCPLCEEESYMCEEGKIFSLFSMLLRTFEFRRAKWLNMSGSLHTVYRTSTHTRLAHMAGSAIVAVNCLKHVKVYPKGNTSMSLGEYLSLSNIIHEFLCACYLHDIGHAPLSHVLEPSPFLDLDHEKITYNLILGERDENQITSDDIDWYFIEKLLLKKKNYYDYIETKIKNNNDLDVIKAINEQKHELDGNIVTVKNVLDNFGISKANIVAILKGKTEKNQDPTGSDEMKDFDLWNIQFLHVLLESEIDIDRIDHIKRDASSCGVSLINFKLSDILDNISILLPSSEFHNNRNESDTHDEKPIILFSESAIPYIMDLLHSRSTVFRDVMFSNENNWINGVVNLITSVAVILSPHIKMMLPFITDQILMYMYSDKAFANTQIEKFNKLFQGKGSYLLYDQPLRYKINETAKKDHIWWIDEEDPNKVKERLKWLYREVVTINSEFENYTYPAVIMYTNIKAKKRGGKSASNPWNSMFFLEKFYEGGGDKKLFSFNDLAGKYDCGTRDRFPERPNEADVKNLLYIWFNKQIKDDKKDELKLRLYHAIARDKLDEKWEIKGNKKSIEDKFFSCFYDMDVPKKDQTEIGYEQDDGESNHVSDGVINNNQIQKTTLRVIIPISIELNAYIILILGKLREFIETNSHTNNLSLHFLLMPDAFFYYPDSQIENTEYRNIFEDKNKTIFYDADNQPEKLNEIIKMRMDEIKSVVNHILMNMRFKNVDIKKFIFENINYDTLFTFSEKLPMPINKDDRERVKTDVDENLKNKFENSFLKFEKDGKSNAALLYKIAQCFSDQNTQFIIPEKWKFLLIDQTDWAYNDIEFKSESTNKNNEFLTFNYINILSIYDAKKNNEGDAIKVLPYAKSLSALDCTLFKPLIYSYEEIKSYEDLHKKIYDILYSDTVIEKKRAIIDVLGNANDELKQLKKLFEKILDENGTEGLKQHIQIYYNNQYKTYQKVIIYSMNEGFHNIEKNIIEQLDLIL